MSRALVVVVLLALVGGAVYIFTGNKESKQLGHGVPDAEITDIGSIRGEDWNRRHVTVKGEITQKCPTTGCWFYLKDSTGEIRVDTAPSGFTVTEIPKGRTVTVHGTVSLTSEGEAELVAMGVK